MRDHDCDFFVERSSGFTMIELIMVIVILGILAAVAIPKFTNLSSNARTAAVAGVAGGLASANSTNVATCAAGGGVVGANCVSTTGGCTNAVADTLLQGGVPAGYTVSGATSASGGAAPQTVTCTLTDDSSGATSTFTITGAP
ncbi:MAG: prepilin-type N-terminal cleavage/methylation domain-containing protein [Magnetococcales bacterium]|nr:prepilin-type N-terminal cleavage/methylation domain-containing protein [Magnetococcales bacterium]